MIEVENSRKSENASGEVLNGISRKPLKLLQALRWCQDAWAPMSPWDRHEAHAALWGRPVGSFLVVQDSLSRDQLLCVSIGDSMEPVKEFPIITSETALRLAASHLAFPDLYQLLHFYCLSRDVLPVRLQVPLWVYSIDSLQGGLHPQLSPKTWLCPSTEFEMSSMTHGTLDAAEMAETLMCTIQVTAATGAMCFINPLYVQEHGDDWLTQSVSQSASAVTPIRRDKHLSSTRVWESRGLKSSAAVENPRCFDPEKGSSDKSLTSSTAAGDVVLRKASQKEDPIKRESFQIPGTLHRVSWIEDRVWANTPLPSSHLQPHCLELDSLSVSSMEEETECDTGHSPSSSHQSHRFHLTDKMMNRLSAVGQALGGLVLPQRRLNKRVQEMAERRGRTFGEALREFLEKTLESEAVASCSEMLQEVRSSLTSLRETLLDCPEIQSIIDGFGDTPDFELDAMLELALHKVALKPVFAHLYTCLKIMREEDGTLQNLVANKCILEGRNIEELEGAAGAGVPDSTMMEKIQQRWSSMHEAYSPSKKVDSLLKVCKNIYHSMNANAKPGAVFGADDFLPCLTWVILRSDVVTLQLDTDYMMELLDPIQLQGEGGYYLTSLYAALFYISSFRPRLAKRQLSSEAHQSLSQWHHRRTLHCNQFRRSRNRRTIRRLACKSPGAPKASDSLKESTESKNTQETLQGLDEKEEERHLEQKGERSLEAVPGSSKDRQDVVSWNNQTVVYRSEIN